MISKETNQQVREISPPVPLVKRKPKKKEKFFTNEDIVIFFMSLGMGVLFLLLIWIFEVSIPTSWIFYP
jgi:hypothetical protein